MKCRNLFESCWEATHYVRAGCEKVLKWLSESHQVVLIRGLRNSRFRPFKEYFAKHGILFDAEYKDVRTSKKYPQDYSQIIKDFKISRESILYTVLVTT